CDGLSFSLDVKQLLKNNRSNLSISSKLDSQPDPMGELHPILSGNAFRFGLLQQFLYHRNCSGVSGALLFIGRLCLCQVYVPRSKMLVFSRHPDADGAETGNHHSPVSATATVRLD